MQMCQTAPATCQRLPLRALLHALSNVEAEGYAALGDLGASPPRATRVFTAGGGARNEKWRAIREGAIGSPVLNLTPPRADACYGAALLGLGLAVGSPKWEAARHARW